MCKVTKSDVVTESNGYVRSGDHLTLPDAEAAGTLLQVQTS